MNNATLFAIGAYFALMLAIGVYAWRKSTSDSSEYLLSGRSLGPAVTALAAGASDMSGWLMLGLPGALYASGLVESWIAIGLFIGAWANWLVVAPRLRAQTESYGNALTIPEYLGNRFEDQSHRLRLVASLVIVIFFAIYSASGLVAGGKLFQTAFGFDYQAGLWITATVVVAYVVLGGFLAVSLTDFVQGCIMMVALIVVPAAAVLGLPETSSVRATLDAIDPGMTSLLGGTTALAIVSAAAWGLGYFGQPHIIVRFMAIRSVKDIPTARRIGMSWMGISLLGAIAVGLVGRAFAESNGIAVADPETIFILLGETLFHPLIFGFLLSAILAAVMSTISAQLLVTGSSLTEDFYRLFIHRAASEGEIVTVGRLSVVGVAAIAMLLAQDPEGSVLKLVSHAWAGFGAAFGPLILFALTWRRMTLAGALAGMITGAAVVMIWIQFGWDSSLYELLPGFIAAALAILVVSLVTKPPQAETRAHG
ncbi:sodium/proline symporter PutP [Sphingopyxis flava]|uniref:Sodium/proline symporter n=1 Tax=Sphingopyxis flava TaxID=1507287 RepID=A0A1T5AAC3_9SPHN|nr:sodium/proline symporter PutP [Sphingopyxis flava]SKB31799.1 solute:Na+ symporter, SSS family [Sphingopyxis flava]